MKRSLAILFVFMGCGLCAAVPVRVAIIADEASRPVADLLTAKLSADKNLVLVERAEIDKVIQEHQLSFTDALEQQLDISKLLRAQGMLILETVKEGGKPALHARLVAVEQGVVILDTTTPLLSDKPEEVSRLLSARVIPLFPKLAVEHGRAIPISIMNVRAVYASGEPVQLEHTVTALLASRLTLEPSVFVLERRRLHALSAEKMTGDEPSAAFWNGSFLLDGSIENAGQDGSITIHLRLRRPDNGGKKIISLQGRADSLRELVEKLTKEILTETGVQVRATSWDPDAEARQYTDEAVWARTQGEYELAIDAIESATALETAPDGEVLFLRAWLYAKKASFYREEIVGRIPREVPLQERYDAIMKASDACQQYLEGKFAAKNPQFETKYEGRAREEEIRGTVVREASATLVELTDHPSKDAPDPGTLRRAIRRIEPFDLGAGKLPGDRWEIPAFAHYWADGPDEMILYYYTQMQSDNGSQKVITTDLVNHLIKYRERVFDRNLHPRGNAMYEQTGMDTSAPSRYADAPGIYQRLIEKLAVNPRTELISFLMRSGGSAPEEDRKVWFGKFLDEFWNRREQLMKEGNFSDWLENIGSLDPVLQGEYPDRQIKLLRYFLVNGDKCWEDFFKALWKPETFPADQAGDIWKEYNAYRQRSHALAKSQYDADKDVCAKAFLEAFPVYKPAAIAKVNDDPLIVTGWHSYGIGTPGSRSMIYGATQSEGKLWIFGQFSGEMNCRVLGIDLQNFTMESAVITPAGRQIFGMLVTPDAFYVQHEGTPAGMHTGALSRYDRKKQKWETHQIPWENPAVYQVNGVIYLGLQGRENGVQIGGLARYDWDTGTITYLASNRRRPGQNQFDDCNPYFVPAVFEGPGHKACAIIGGIPYYIREQPGNWTALDADLSGKKRFLNANVFGDKTLIYSDGGDWAYYVDPAGKDVETWVAKTRPSLWDPAPEMQKYLHSVPAVHFGLAPGGFLFMDPVGDSPDHFELRWFRRGSPRVGDKITILLKNPAAPKPQPFGYFSNNPIGPAPSAAINTPGGIVVWNNGSGFWFISYAEIENHLKEVKQKSFATAPSPVEVAKHQ